MLLTRGQMEAFNSDEDEQQYQEKLKLALDNLKFGSGYHFEKRVAFILNTYGQLRTYVDVEATSTDAARKAGISLVTKEIFLAPWTLSNMTTTARGLPKMQFSNLDEKQRKKAVAYLKHVRTFLGKLPPIGPAIVFENTVEAMMQALSNMMNYSPRLKYPAELGKLMKKLFPEQENPVQTFLTYYGSYRKRRPASGRREGRVDLRTQKDKQFQKLILPVYTILLKQYRQTLADVIFVLSDQESYAALVEQIPRLTIQGGAGESKNDGPRTPGSKKGKRNRRKRRRGRGGQGGGGSPNVSPGRGLFSGEDGRTFSVQVPLRF